MATRASPPLNPAEPRTVTLTPELWNRLERLAKARGVTVERIVADAVMVAWVRYATNEQIQGNKW